MGKERMDEMQNNLAEKIEQKRISYEELLQIDDDRRYELIDGVPYLMASPRVSHQKILLEIAYQLRTYLRGKRCEVFISPLDVKISGQKDNRKEYNVVQPDVMVVCDPEKITEKNILGAPDLAIEILSPSNPGHDRLRKLNLYQDFGVREYWIVSLEEKIIEVFIRNNEGVYTLPRVYYLNDKIKVNILNDCYIDLKEFCKENDIEIKKSEIEIETEKALFGEEEN